MYETRGPIADQQLLQTIPEAKQINGKYFAVPRTIRNAQILRLFDYPVPPIMDGYDWPRHPSIKQPYETQKLAANYMLLHPRSFNLSDMGCVAGETLIETAQGQITIANLEQQQKPFLVRSANGYVLAPSPFKKGYAPLYRVTFASGRAIIVTQKHVFLTSRGWRFCANLAVGERLPVFDAALQQSISELCPSKSHEDDRRLKQTELNYQECLQTLSCDGQLLLDANSDQVLIPLQGDFLKHTPLLWRTGGLGTIHRCKSRNYDAHRSTHHYGDRCDLAEMGFFLSECATKQSDNHSHTYEQCRQYPILEQEVLPDQELQSCIRLVLACSNLPVDTVTHIAYERYDVYYDMHVPHEQNYIAHGLCNHNTGKTLAVLWAADQLMRWQPGLKALIVCPLSIMQRVWADAIFQNFLNKRTFQILYGSAEQRITTLARAADFYICNFDGVGVGAHTRRRFELDGFSKALAERKDIKLAIIDEASAYKDASTKRHRIARIVFGQKPYLWLLTGTPTPTAPTDAYGLAKLVNNAMGKSKQTFQMETMYQPFPQSFKWLPRRDGYDKARALLRPAIRIAIEQVWDAPEMTTQARDVLLTDEQKKLMRDLKKDFIVQVKSGAAIHAVNEAAARTKYIQISLGAIYDQQHKAHGIDAKPRYEELVRVLEEAPGKCLVFAPLTSVIGLIYNTISKRWATEIVNGDVSQKQRSDIFRAFQTDEKPRIIVADPGTMSHGLDLFAARTVIWFGPTDKPELYAQANHRAHRPGQKFPVTIVQLISNPLEREIFRRLENNLALQGALLDLVQRGAL